MRLLSAKEMAAVDRRAIENLGIPGMVLMENASVGVADAIGERFGGARSVVIFCGPGNNGGDGLALTRILEARGYHVRSFLVLGSKVPAGDAGLQLEILRRAGREVTELTSETDLEPAIDLAASADLVVDALFGTGLTRGLEGHFAELVTSLDRLPVPVVAVDLPSGLNGSSGEIPGPYLTADLTVTFAAPKIAQVMPPACAAVGELAVVDLGIPPELVEEAPGRLHLLTLEDVRAMGRGAALDAHKGTQGHVLVVAGSTGKSGAAILSSRAAVRGGAGLVSVAVPSSLLSFLEQGSVESMTLPLAETSGGCLATTAFEQLLRHAQGKSVLALGPGLGAEPTVRDGVWRLLEGSDLPIVLDADGLNALGGDLDRLSQRGAPTLLTPHPGEAARLLGISSADVQADRLAAASRLASAGGAFVALKGFRTVIAEPDGELWINATGSAALATGGSGDVLTGWVAALVAQGYDPASALKIGVYVHGLAGERVAEQLGIAGTSAGDLPVAMAKAWNWISDPTSCERGKY